ncbi:MAG: molybdate ABC transporter substrate-binding protein [Raoultibacter sp.]
MNLSTKAQQVSKYLLAALIATVLAASVALTGCSSGNNKEAESTTEKEAIELSIFAANSLEKAMPEVQALYTEKNPEITFADTQFKGSGDLVAQLEGGASADLLITASKATMDQAEEGALIATDTRKDMFGNDLVIVRAEGSDIAINALTDVAAESISRIAIGDSASVPAGTYANQSLNSVGLYSSDTGKGGEYDASIASKVALADKVGTAAQYVSTGDCQIGFVYSSDVYRYSGIEVAFVTPEDSHKAIKYPGAVCAKSTHSEEAQAFLDFCLNDADAQEIWAKYGFELL